MITRYDYRSDPYSALQVLTRVSERSCDLIEHTHSNRSCDLTPSNDCIIMIISELLTTADYIQHNYNDIHARYAVVTSSFNLYVC